MAKFAYKARDEKGALITGNIDADNKQAVYAQIDSMGLYPVHVSEVTRQSESLNELFARFQRIKNDDLIFFTRQLQTIIRAGIPLISGLKALEEQTANTRLKTAIRAIYQDIDRGKTFSDALERHSGIFSELYVSMVRAAELGGVLDDVLARLSELLEFQMKTKEMMKSAMRYPIFVIVALVIAFMVLMTAVVPRFMSVFKEAKMELPLPTQILVILNNLIQEYGVYLFFAVVAAVIGFIVWVRSEQGAYLFDKFKLHVPLIGPIVLKICMSRFANMLENLIKAGVPIIQTLEIVSRTIGNAYIGAKIKEIEAKIGKGMGIAGPLKEANIFPPLVIHLVSTGEETGSLEDMLKEVSIHYDREITYSVTRLSAWIEPILTMGLAVMVLFLALAIFMPWWNMMNVMKGGGGH
ncbi:MAG: type II secretion system F family protein [Syntrophus sp. (in: bacteria)]|nr:type II secretion system F family protein [Syntrophus sp. (in: bacteria)]